MASMMALNTVYNYYLTTYSRGPMTKYDTHKKSELRDIYNSIVKLNKESPGCYKIIFVSGINPADKNCAPGLSVLDIFSNTNDFKKEATHYHFCYDPHKET